MDKFLGFLIALFLKTIALSYRLKFVNLSFREEAENSNKAKSYVLAFWHQNILSSVISQNHRKHVAIVSASKDGDLAVNVARQFGYNFVRGSSSRGGGEAMLKMIHKIKEEGIPGGITIDGPRGPSHEVKRGVIEIAKLTQTPILPLLAYPEKFWSFKSWDKFRFPRPFTKIHIIYGKPIFVPEHIEKDDFDFYAQTLKESLTQLEDEIIKKIRG